MWRVRLILLTLLYVISPIDLVPEIVFGPVGAIDDVIVIINAIKKLREGNQV
ncbi:DUF1232 domain-containing protein [Gemmata sp. G18]|uniref:DUF1232 domain-containing protein n=1 Tax=Gemmata palustris TaxID=2822762 RepID=A0ABS5BYC1_9BACT|nr:YkvA family protein [Gemmata palustris]MBP3958407.1 DUF1232 domain-containing protein [Gemmata palustris]